MSVDLLRADHLHHPGDTSIHRLAPEVKVAALAVFVLAVVATPREALWAFALDGTILVAVIAVAGLPAGLVLRRLRIELPFLAFAVFLPIVGSAPRVEVFGVSLSEAGLWAAWGIIAKGTLGVTAAIILAATTPAPEVLTGLERLRVPRALVAIAGFMVRYLDLVISEADRMRIARLSRGDDPRWLWQARAIATSAGTLFVRSYERGERVHLAMCARGFTGTMPLVHQHPRASASWVAAAMPPALATVAMVLAQGAS